MTNLEYWKYELLKIDDDDIAIVDDKPISCYGTSCMKCKFNNNCRNSNLVRWLLEEHKEKPKLTIKERKLCEILETGYIVRIPYAELFYHVEKPWKENGHWKCENTNYRCLNQLKEFCSFNFIKEEDIEPWSIEDLLKLEVVK